MSFVYYSLLLTSGPAFTNLAALQSLPWTSPSQLLSLYSYLNSLDFSNYDARKVALNRIRDSYLPVAPFYTFSFDETDPPVPLVQSRFRNSDVYVSLSGSYSAILSGLARSLAITDSDPNYSDLRDSFYSNLVLLENNINGSVLYFDRITFETTFLLVWSIYPPP